MVRQWIGVAPATKGAAIADDKLGPNLLQAAGAISGCADMNQGALYSLSPSGRIVTELNSHISGKLNQNTIHRVIAGYNPSGSSLFFPPLRGRTLEKSNSKYFYTNCGDGIITTARSRLGNTNEKFDILSSPNGLWHFNHVFIPSQAATTSRIVAYYTDPSIGSDWSDNKLPPQKCNIDNPLQYTRKISKDRTIGIVFEPVLSKNPWIAAFGTLINLRVIVAPTEQSYIEMYSMLSTDSLLEHVRITVVYESGKKVELTPENTEFSITEDSLLCSFEPEEAGAYRIEITPVDRETFGFDGRGDIHRI